MVRDSIDWGQKDDAYVNAAFDFADADAKPSDEDDEDMSKKQTDAQRRQLSQDGARQPAKVVDSRGKRAFIDSNKWRVTTGQMTEAELMAKATEQFGG